MKKVYIIAPVTSKVGLKTYGINYYKMLKNNKSLSVYLVDEKRTTDNTTDVISQLPDLTLFPSFEYIMTILDDKSIVIDASYKIDNRIKNIISSTKCSYYKFIDLDIDRQATNIASFLYDLDIPAIFPSRHVVESISNVFDKIGHIKYYIIPYQVDNTIFNPDVKPATYNLVADIKYLIKIQSLNDISYFLSSFVQAYNNKIFNEQKIHLIFLCSTYIPINNEIYTLNVNIPQQIVSYIALNKHNNMKVTIINDFLSQQELASLFKYVDYVMLISNSAFNRMAFEAASVGKVIICDKNSNYAKAVGIDNIIPITDKDLTLSLKTSVDIYNTETYNKMVDNTSRIIKEQYTINDLSDTLFRDIIGSNIQTFKIEQ